MTTSQSQPKFEFRFEYEALYEEITSERDYERLSFRDKPLAERKAIKTIAPLRCANPYSTEKLESFRTMKQPSDDWMEARDSFLTSSRFPHIAGEQCARFGSPMQYWREITGRVDAQEFGEKQKAYVAHGQRCEPIARRRYELLTGTSVNEEGLRVLDEAPWIYSASSDGLIENSPQTRGIIEIKCNATKGPRDFVPHHYIAQMMGAMAVYKAPFCDFINYWAKPLDFDERFLYCCRVYWNEKYWKLLKMRLDYMAWCIAYDRAPTGMGELILRYPLPDVKLEERHFYVGTTFDDEGVAFVPRPPPSESKPQGGDEKK